MKQIFTWLFLCLGFNSVFSAAGIFAGGVTIAGVTYWENGFTLNNRNISVNQGSSLLMTFAYARTFKNGGDNICSATMHYSVYPASGSPSFTAVNLPFAENLCCGNPGDQEWNTNGGGGSGAISINLANGLAPGSYKIAVYYSARGHASGGNCSSTFEVFLSNGGNNYVANLTVNAVAPVELTTFKSLLTPQKEVALFWSTASERDNDYFEVEHSTAQNAQVWTPIGQVKAEGDGSRQQDYHFTHRNPRAGANFYRLRQVDTDGDFSYSPVVRTDVGASSLVAIAPNPVQDQVLRLQWEDAGEWTAHIELMDPLGRLQRNWNIEIKGAQTLAFPLEGLAPGIYFLQINQQSSLRVVVE